MTCNPLWGIHIAQFQKEPSLETHCSPRCQVATWIGFPLPLSLGVCIGPGPDRPGDMAWTEDRTGPWSGNDRTGPIKDRPAQRCIWKTARSLARSGRAIRHGLAVPHRFLGHGPPVPSCTTVPHPPSRSTGPVRRSSGPTRDRTEDRFSQFFGLRTRPKRTGPVWSSPVRAGSRSGLGPKTVHP